MTRDQENKPATRVRLKEQAQRVHKPAAAKPARREPNRRPLTEARIANLKADRERNYLVWDDGLDGQRGLAVMVMPSGTKTYYCYFYLAGSSTATSMKLGRVGELRLEEARRRTGEARQKAHDGFDPRLADPRRSVTFSEALETWHVQEQTSRKGNRSAVATRSFVLHHCKRWVARPLATIRTEEIDDLLVDVRDVQKKGPSANRLHAHLATLFKWAARTRRIAASPMAAMPKPVDKIKPRDRAWFRGAAADDVIKRLWGIASGLGGDREVFLKLLILLGKRRTAVMTMRWEDIDQQWFWTGAQTSDSKRTTPIPLPKLAQRIIGPRQASGRVMMVTEGAIPGLLNDLRKRLELPDFLIHGLRHVCETRLGELGVPPHIRDLLLDHAVVRSQTARGYDHGMYKDQLLEALEKWAKHVAELVAPGEGVAVLR